MNKEHYIAGAVFFAGILIACAMFLIHPDKLSGVCEKLDALAQEANSTGTGGNVECAVDPDDVVILSPPYADVKRFAAGAADTLTLQTIAQAVNTHETGHLFYIRKGRILDHCTLSGVAEPVFGVAKSKKVTFKVSRRNTSGRPVRVEISSHAQSR